MPARTKANNSTKNPWVEHVKKFKREHPNLDGNLFQEARKTYITQQKKTGMKKPYGLLGTKKSIKKKSKKTKKIIEIQFVNDDVKFIIEIEGEVHRSYGERNREGRKIVINLVDYEGKIFMCGSRINSRPGIEYVINRLKSHDERYNIKWPNERNPETFEGGERPESNYNTLHIEYDYKPPGSTELIIEITKKTKYQGDGFCTDSDLSDSE